MCIGGAKGSHKIYQCDMFKGMSPERRFKYATENHLCFNCLLSSHRAQDCTRNSMCNVQGCKYKHSRLLHFDLAQTTVKSVNNNACYDVQTSVYVPMVPVIVNGSYHTWALLDTGPTNTFMSRKLVTDLKLKVLAIT